MNKNIKLIIFDCDGVLIDSEIISATVLIEKLRELSVDIDMGYVQRHFLGYSFKSVTEKVFATFSVSLPEGFEAEYRAALLEQFRQELQPTQGIKALLSALKLKFCLATSSSRERTSEALRISGLAGFFTATVFTAEDVTRGKPAPDLFQYAAAKMGVAPSECLVIEDSRAGVAAAIAAGMQVIHYTGGRHISGAVSQVSDEFPQVPVLDSWAALVELLPEAE
ncbi:HAD family hydrolase [Zhongshania sp.]|uniref:HAD family hydrolase n=1 Tax=Zhongshania sp. TaxID=1971902 RepID=UPI00356763B8